MSIPAHLRPKPSRGNSGTSHQSAQSTSRQPQPQHREFTGGASAVIAGEAVDDVIPDLWQYDQSQEGPSGAYTADGPDEGEEGESVHSEEWDNLRDGSIARRPAWRRPSPSWVYFFIVGATISMGMCMAPKSEIFINLACLAHPPQQHRSSDTLSPSYLDMGNHHTGGALDTVGVIWKDADMVNWDQLNEGDISLNTSIPSSRPERHRSAADEWFLKLQRDIYEYNMKHHSHPSTSSPSTTISQSTVVSGSTLLPQPTGPSDRPPYDIPKPQPVEDKPGPNRPYIEIDPELCKRDAKVQAAAAKITMSKSTWTYDI